RFEHLRRNTPGHGTCRGSAPMMARLASLAAIGLLAACSGGPDGGLPGLLAGSGGGTAGGDTTSSGSGGDETPEVPAEEDPFDPPPAPPPLPQDVVDALAAEMHQALDGPGGTNSALIVGADTGQVIFARNPDQVMKPASNTKLFTTAAAMAHHGEEHRATSRVYATEDPSDGVVDGNLVLVCEHDFTTS